MTRTKLSLAAAALLAAAACSQGSETQAGADAPGRALFASICGACHMAAPPGSAAAKMRTIGPNLWGVVGRPSAATDFDYSPAMRAARLVWDEKTLDEFLTNPQKLVPNTRMALAGLDDPEQRKAIIDYLKTQK
ncbi:MAG: c-type cytochrome [Alphaproteobacteria bacterium]|nr:c-type cytochrome [Alphaproteobacteria bacterium]